MIPDTDLPEISRRKHLSPAEQKVVELVATGIPTKEVATYLNKSTATVRNQLYAAMRKLDMRSSYELFVVLRPSRSSVAVPEPEVFAYAV